MPWTRQGGKFVWVTTQAPAPVIPQIGSNTSTNRTLENGIVVGDVVQYSGTTMSQYPNFHLNKATSGGVVAGLVDSGGAVADVGMAWVIDEPRELPLSGIYQRTVNGLADGQVVVIVGKDNSFVMARTKDDDVEILRDRFNALVSS